MIRIKFKHNDEYYECKGIKKDNKIEFVHNTDKINIELNDNFINLIKENDESNVNMTFKINEITRCTYNVKELGTIYLNVKTEVLKINDNKLYIEYEIIESQDKHTYELEYEVI